MVAKYFFQTIIKNIKRPTTAGILTGVAVHWAIMILAYLWYNAVVNQSEIALVHEIGTVKNNIEEKFNKTAASLSSLSLAIEHDGSVHEFESVASDIKNDHPGINTISILPGGVYQYFYPEKKDHQSIKGFNLLKDGDEWTKKKIQEAIRTKSAVFIGPFQNVSNDSIVITINPVFIRGQFWGLTLLTMKVDDLVKGIAAGTSKDLLGFSISNIHPLTKKEYFFYSSGNQASNAGKIRFNEKVSHNNWRLYGLYAKPSFVGFLFIPLILSLLVAFIVGAYVNSLVNTPKDLKGRMRATEEELERYDLRFKSIYENAPIGIAQIDFTSRKIKEVNQKFCQLLGVSKDDALNHGLWEFLSPDFYKDAYDQFQKVISGESDQLEKYFKHTNKTGKEAWVHATLKPIRDSSGNIDNHILVVEDVTEAELARNALAASEEQYRNFVHNSPIALSEYDHSGVKEYLIEHGLINKSYDELHQFFTKDPASLKACNDRIKHLIVNVKSAEIFGFDNVDEFLEAQQHILYVPHNWKLAIKTFAAISNGDWEIIFEENIITKNEEKKYINYHWSVLPGHEEKFDHVIVTMTDITNVKKTEAAILEAQNKILDSEKRFRGLFEDSPIALWEEDFSGLQKYFIEKGLMGKTFNDIYMYFAENKNAFEECFQLFKIISVNKESVELYDAVSKAELLKNVKFLLSSPQSMHYTILALTGLSNNILSSNHETSINTMSGRIKYINYQWNVMPGHEHDFSRVIVAMIDITQQKEAEMRATEAANSLKISQERFRSLFFDSPIALWEEDYSDVKLYMKSIGIWGKSQHEIAEYFTNHPEAFYENISKIRILSVNKEALAIYKASDVDELRQVFSGAANMPESKDVFLMQFAELGSGNLKFRKESTSVNDKGELIALDLNWNVLPGYEESLGRVIVATNDITLIKQSEAELRKAKEDLENSLTIVSEQNKQLMQFSYIVSHNLRSHAANLQSLSELIVDPESSPEEKNEYATHLHNITKILSDTMEGLNEVTQIQTSGNLTIKPLNLKLFVRKTIDILSNKITEKQAIIKTEIDENVVVNYYQPYLESVLLCFISNAIKYSSSERQPVIQIIYTQDQGQKVLLIKDNGIGIDLEQHGSRMFGLFKTFTSNPDSRGIGLYITKHQIEVMGGSVSVDSTPGVGTTFRIVFR